MKGSFGLPTLDGVDPVSAGAALVLAPLAVFGLVPQRVPAIASPPGGPEPAVVTSAKRSNHLAVALVAAGAAAAAYAASRYVSSPWARSAGTGAAIGSALLAVGMLASAPAAPAAGPPEPPSPGPEPEPVPPQTLPAFVERAARLYSQPDVTAPVEIELPRGTPIDVETASRPGWVYAYVVPAPGVAAFEGFLQIEDVTYTQPTLAAPSLGVVLGRVPVARIAVPRPLVPPSGGQTAASGLLLDPNVPASSVLNRPSKIVPPSRAVSTQVRYLTGEQAPDDPLLLDTLRELHERLAQLDAYYKAVWRPRYGQDLPETIKAGSEWRSFDAQAGIVAIQLRMSNVSPESDEAAIRQALLRSLTTRSVPGFSRHHWGTEVDVVSATETDWLPGGSLARLVPFMNEEAPRFGLYNPYRDGAFPEPARPHYHAEPWHLSLYRRSNVFKDRWLAEVQSAELEALYDRIASRLAALSDAPAARVRAVLPTLDLPSYVRNVSPAPRVS